MLKSNLLNNDDNDSWIIYTKSNCGYCSKVKELLEKEPIITIINCDNWLNDKEKKEKFLNLIKVFVGCEWRTFPIVFLNDKFIGGYAETEKFFNNKNNEKLIINDDF